MLEPRLKHLDHVRPITNEDAKILVVTDMQYNASWKKRGGVGAYMMLARKWDRLEQAVTKYHYDIFEAAAQDNRAESLVDDIRDLRRYLTLVEAELRRAGPHQFMKLTERDQEALKEFHSDWYFTPSGLVAGRTDPPVPDPQVIGNDDPHDQ